ncbi:NAD-dependent DNA ligase LigA [Anaerocolumna aminovalerica]|uniref:DNA ligase n=1 Tax=Anaerocolumna aminovalerica TaxID=1527 RepID=A0A1I5FDP9_9FIRM|nr:NAD-dependent DNA ligase LigA [Anaerocolumna aminovalerica]MBU5331771.1 NAD-dependent DNA ligase LigA [Anaerocolumna aminovalerica]MDU6264005.1 NAD-dependent DNA ligase LigA [Anaerocolumna aminovalerica]SFO21852.1 DNA ligase (NAD+) [Anaerocolumna aminovalerica]
MEDKLHQIKELVNKLNLASKAYYQEDKEIMSNYEYDALYDQLVELEKETGIVLSNSPTRTVGYEILSVLPKVRHDVPMLSLDKTKDVLALKSWLGNQKGLLSWKLDGLTVVLTYQNGKLEKAVTRGNGEIGEVITNNAKVFKNLPITISYTGELVLRGEAVIKYSDFEKINKEIEDVDAKYKNPRNLCSGSVRQLNNEITAKRNVHFFAFGLVNTNGDIDFNNSRQGQLQWLTNLGFDTVESKLVTEGNIEETVEWFSGEITKNDFPSDGLVLIYDDINYGRSLGRTAKFPRDSIAFKWMDEIRETTLKEIEWSASRTGLINPIAVFEPVELEGTTVSRASIHNISIMESLELGVGDTIQVYKANMIIPQISENLTRSGNMDIPEKCPVCGEPTKIHNENDVKALYCENSECLAKKIKSLTHFVSRDAMNIEGLSEATIEKLIAKGLIHELADLFYVEKYKDVITKMEGFGEKSYQNLVKSIEKARHVSPAKFLYSLGILNIGLSNAKLISKEFNHDFDKIRNASKEELMSIPGIGDVIADSFIEFFREERNQNIVDDLLKVILFEKQETNSENLTLAGKTFVITGSVEHFTNRNEVKEVIEQNGGKVTGSVTTKTDYLINNDILSNSSKNKKAKELGIPIITEEEFVKMIS